MNARLTIAGEMSIYRAAELKERLIDALGEADAVLEVELAGVTEIDTAGVQLLMLTKREADASGRRLQLLSHSRAVAAAFELLNLAGFFGDPILVEGER
ncbi:lipid asymmetry maintenance protein MlaB [Burkholderiaceae bacterium UC74_6]